MVREFTRVIGDEARAQCLERFARLPDHIVACVGGGSNALGIFSAFLDDVDVQLWGVEAGGRDIRQTGQHAASLGAGTIGILHGALTYVLQDDAGQIAPTHSISAGLDYPAVGPEHAYLKSSGRTRYVSVDDAEALDAFAALARLEGIVPALESAHAVAYAKRLCANEKAASIILVNCSGRGDKDAVRLQAQEAEAAELMRNA